ncbi:hypothetical protein LPJ53_003317 [Coemansia erecta]|uniref:Integral membrane bound transporter domain-containing protein n=1 Tax=Coemansia erecta TaxID=147472 RepID=A0A9W8CQY7_9FUNG|nr:hypothetical protein LPJ53_003317 [Coemansia erecta]
MRWRLRGFTCKAKDIRRWYGWTYAWLQQQRTQNYIKAVLSCTLASMLMFIEAFRVRIGTLYFQVLITTAMAHGGMTVGANLELQLQQIFICILVSAYILVIEAIVYGLGQNPHISHDVAAMLTRAVGLAIYCFVLAIVYSYTPRLSLPMKINTASALLALTSYPELYAYEVRPLPGIVYAQLVGAGISTCVNIFVMPSTSSRRLVGAFRGLLKEMHACCVYFDQTVPALGLEALGRRLLDSEKARERRVGLRRAAELFGRVVGGSRYETTIERFSQVDYHRIFLRANKLASVFGTMCLPFEIDEQFHQHLENPVTKMQHGTMTHPNSSMASLLSCNSERRANRSTPASEESVFHGAEPGRTIAELAERHRRQEMSRQGVLRALLPIRAQIALHQQILDVLLERTERVERSSPTRSLFEMVLRAVKSYTRELPGDIGHSAHGQTHMHEVIPESLVCENPEMASTLHDGIARMSLEQMAEAVSLHAQKYEKQVTECIRIIAPYSAQESERTHERHVVLLSFIGALRENAACMARMLLTLHRIDVHREDRVRIWFPKLSWNWLYRGRVDEEDEEEDSLGADAENWDLANAFGTDVDSLDEHDSLARERRKSRMPSESPESSEFSSSESESELEINMQLRRQSAIGSDSVGSIASSSGMGSSGTRPAAQAQEETEVGAIYKTIDHPLARVARAFLDWLGRPKTRYAIKFTLSMLAWAVWAFIHWSRHFFIRNNASWGLSCIAAVLGVTIGSTLRAGLTRVLGVTLSGAWGIVVWRSSDQGYRTILPCTLCILYFVASFYMSFFTRRLSSVSPIMVISFASVLFSAYVDANRKEGTSLAWKHVSVNIVAIVFAFFVSALFMPYKARTALRRRLAETLRLNSLVTQSINHMHSARAEFPLVRRKEYRRVVAFVGRSRVLLAKCRQLVEPAEHEPSVHERFQTAAHTRLIDSLELQLEWLLYSFFSHATPTEDRDALAMTIRLAMAMREDIIGAKSAFNSMLAAALYSRSRLPAYLPDIGTARHEFTRRMHPLLRDQYTRSFEVTYLSRWHVGLWHVIGTQTDLVMSVRAIVGAETDRWPEEVGFMLDSLALAPPGQVSAQQPGQQPGQHGRWFSRLPKYAA